ncbi:MAG TPA: XdhC family protein [Bacillota bacterium]
MIDIVEGLVRALKSGEKVALATVIGVKGSAPRSPGARMAVRGAGGHLGTVGGGCGEGDVIRTGLGALDDGRARRVKVEMIEAVTEEAEAACGGTMDVVIAPFGAELLPVAEAVRKATDERRTMKLLTCLEPARALGAMAVVGEGGRVVVQVGWGRGEVEALAGALAGQGGGAAGAANPHAAGRAETPEAPARVPAVELSGEKWSALVEDLVPPAVLLICGGGHIALPLSEMGKIIGFDVVVIDDRPSFADPGRFRQADKVVCAPFDQAVGDFPVDARTYAVVVTRGHRHDVVCVRHLLGRGVAYVGMIGSRRRVTGVLDMLRAEGHDEAALAELYSPIGLDIGAETPGEIALSILAEIVQVRRGGGGRHLSLTQGPKA